MNKAKVFTIVFSNYTGHVFAWEGNSAKNRVFLGNRSILGNVTAANPDDAINIWKTKHIA